MISEPLAEKASLYALDLLHGEERACFEAKVRKEPELEALVRRLQEDVSQLALAAPQHSAPPDTWEKIRAEIEKPEKQDTPVSFPATERSFYRTWAIAASIALAFALVLVVLKEEATRFVMGEEGPAEATQKEWLNLLGEHERLAAKAEALAKELETTSTESEERKEIIAELDATIAALEEEIENTGSFSSALLNHYRRMAEQGVTMPGVSSKGISRIVVMEMNRPGSKSSESANLAPGLLADALEDQVLGFLQDQLDDISEGGNGSLAQSDSESGNGSNVWSEGSESSESRSGSSSDGSTASLDEGPQPSPDKATPSNNQQISDEQIDVESDILSDELNRRLRETAEDIVDESTGPNPTGFAIWDPGTQTGSLSLKNIPNVETNQSLQLWYVESETQRPVSIGILPDLEGGSGRVYFNLDQKAVTPNRLLLTVEPKNGSNYPSSKSILESPSQSSISPDDIIRR